MPKARHVQIPLTSPRFEQETVRLLSSVREALAALVAALPSRPATASELQRATRLDMKLCWKVFRVITADGLSGARYIPGQANTRDFLKAMSRLGAPEKLIARAADAINRFDRLVAEHAGDRRTFDSMVCGFSGAQGERVDLTQRREAFQAGSHLFGIQAEALVLTMIQRPSDADPGRLSEIGLRSEFGLRRLRPTPLPLYEQAYATHNMRGQEYSAGRRRSFSGEIAGMGLIPEFCSTPLPEVTVKDWHDGTSTASVMHPELGIKAAVDLVVGFLLPDGAPRYRGEETHSWAVMHVAKPARVIIIDILLEQGTLPRPPAMRGFMTTKNSMTARPTELWTLGQLTDGEPAVRLGRGPEVLAAAEIPRYPDLVSWAITKAGWDPDRFEAWRLRVEYPVALSSVGMVYDMPDRPA